MGKATADSILPGVSASSTWARAAGAGANSAAYMMLKNAGRDDLRLVSATTDAAKTVELHETKMAGGMMQMSPVKDIPIPAGSEVELKPGGLHVMMIGTTRELKVGEKIALTLTFDRGPVLSLSVDVKQ